LDMRKGNVSRQEERRSPSQEEVLSNKSLLFLAFFEFLSLLDTEVWLCDDFRFRCGTMELLRITLG
jgi:hypothetical protein